MADTYAGSEEFTARPKKAGGKQRPTRDGADCFGEIILRISSVRIKGFRSLGDIEVTLANYTSLIGQNDSGKSSFLHALHVLFDPDRAPCESDICKIEGDWGETFVQATLCDCIGHEDLAVDGQIQLRRICRNGKWNWEVMCHVARDATLKKIQAGTLTRGDWGGAAGLPDEVVATVNSKLSELVPSGRIPAPAWNAVFADLNDKNLIEWELGWAPLDKERLPLLVTIVMLEADMRGEEELADGGKSMFNRVSGLLLREATKSHPEMAEAVRQLNEVVQRVATADDEGRWTVPELNDFHRVMQEEVGRFDGCISTHSTLVPPKIPPLEFSVKVEVSDQWVRGIDKMGHGMRRSVLFAMLRAHRRLRTENGGAQPPPADPTQSPLYLFLIEEPELYLHPQAERRRMEELQELAAVDGTQVVLCTHSALFVDLRKYGGILRFDRQERHVTHVHRWEGTSLDSDEEKLLKMAYQFNENKAAMLFAKFVILTEGQTETIMLPFLSKKLGCYDPDVEVVDCAGNQGVPVFQRILEGFGIRYVAWMDRDDNAPSRGKTNTKTLAVIEKVRHDMTVPLGRLIVLKDNWETLAGVPIGTKPYNSWRHFADDENDINLECAAKLKAAYGWESHEDP